MTDDSAAGRDGASSAAPTTVAHFRVIEPLGKGGMGVVYRAEDTALRRTVALKVLAPEGAADERARRRLLREARAAASVTHPNIATIYEVGEAEGRVYIAMELIEGETLRARLRSGGPPSLKEALRVAREIARGLARAHDKHVVHRDLKPDNVMIDAEGSVKILDFGLAKTKEPDTEGPGSEEHASTHITHEGDMLGTPAYMSPEQVAGSMDVDERADVFSFGVLFYELVTGRRPFRGGTTAELVASVLRDEPTPPTRFRAIPASVDAVVLRCLAKDPAARFPNARELLGALDEIDPAAPAAPDTTRDQPTADLSEATLPMLPEEMGTQASTLAGARLSQTAASPAPRSRSGLRTAVVVASLAVAAGLGFTATRGDHAPGVGAGTSGAGTSGAGSSSAAASAPPGTVRGVLAEPPPDCLPAAVAEYRLGMQAIRNIGWSAAEPHFRAAVKLDPECAEAQMRFAMVARSHSSAEAREAYQRARSLERKMSPRAREVLAVFEPVLAMDPPDDRETGARAIKLVERYPDDVEILVLASYQSPAPEKSLEYAKRAVAADRGHADGWQMVAAAHARLGDAKATEAAIEECLREAPSSIDCLSERANLDRALGDCEAMERHLRRAVTKAPSITWLRIPLADAVASRGGSRELVTEVLEPYWAGLEASHGYERSHHRALLAVLYGDFAGGASELERLSGEVAQRQEMAPRVADGLTRLELLLETGERERGSRLAADLARRVDAWAKPVHSGRTAEGWAWFVPLLFVARPSVSPDEREQSLRAWRGWMDVSLTDDVARWAYGEAMLADTPAAAEAALEHLPRGARTPSRLARVDGLRGRALLVANRPADAAVHLRVAARRCDAFEEPFVQTRAHLWLGQALEATGDTRGACDAYGVVLRRWGAARPASVTATTARQRVQKLSCTP